ncbi:Uncharacterised protein [Escherichia coli]|nr:Uncharacterised protein [Escherichia coli]
MAYRLLHHLFKHRTHIIGGDTFAVCRHRYFRDRIIHRQLQYFRIVITTVTRSRDMAYGLFHHLLKHRTHIIGGDTFAVRRYRNSPDRIIHRQLQYFRIVITTVTRSRDMAYGLLHHLLKHRTHIIGGDTFAVRRYRNIRNRIIHRLLQYFRIIITTVTRSRDMAYSLFHHLLKHRTHIIGGDTFAVRRYRNIRNRIIHRLLQYIRIIITTITRYRNGPHSVIHHRLQNRMYLIHRHMLL